jgi:predicted MFS family arabinose efflux permease
MRAALLAMAVGLVLADSSVVTLGLPDVLADFDATPQGVAWVLTGYNLALALAAVPVALWLRGRPAPFARGLALFAAASLACALAPSLGFLVFARCVQGLGGAAVACAALPLLVDALGDRRGAVAIWGAAGAIGAAVGPAAGGALTEALSWEAIFAVQVPLALVCMAAARVERGGAARVEGGGAAGAGRPAWPALAALAFLGAGLTAALFLPVLLLIAGWRHSPLAAAAAVSAMPAAALAAGVLGGALDERARGAAGAILCAGGLAALGLLPGSSVGWLIAPQVLIGLGLGLAVAAVTEEALRDRLPLALHGGWTIAARHAGVVAALAILTPIFTADLEDRTERAQEIVLARILDSQIAPPTKLDLGLRLAGQLRATEGGVPDIAPAFAEAAPGNEDRPAFDALRDGVGDQLDRAAASAFERSFLVAALLAALAVVPLLMAARRRRAP